MINDRVNKSAIKNVIKMQVKIRLSLSLEYGTPNMVCKIIV